MEPPILKEFSKVRRYSNESALANSRDVSVQGPGRYIKMLDAGNDKAVFFDLAGGYQAEHNVKINLKSTNPKPESSYFSLSRMVIPEFTDLVTTPVVVSPKVRRLSTEAILKNKLEISADYKLYIDLAHNFSADENYLHPCHLENCAPDAVGLFSIATEVRDKSKPIVHEGLKACAYTVYTMNPRTFEPNFVFLTKNFVDPGIVAKLTMLYDSTPAAGQKFGTNPNWDKLIMIPLELPNTSIMYYVIPAKEGQTEFEKWIDIARANATTNLSQGRDPKSRIKIDHSLDHLDGWESMISFDAEIIKESKSPQTKLLGS